MIRLKWFSNDEMNFETLGQRKVMYLSRFNKIMIPMIITISIFTFFQQHIQAEDNQEKSDSNQLVYVIPVEKEVERGLEAFLIRSTNEAIEAGADHIVFEIDTPGGRVDSAGQIGKLLQSLDIPTTSFIVNEALSAGSYIALNSDTIYMRPNATMRASGVIRSDGNAAEEKAQSAWIAAMKSAAESNDRDPLYAIAMADKSIDLPELGAPEGEFLTLSPNDAVEVEYAEGLVKNREELLAELDLTDATVEEMETTVAEELARFVTNPVVVPILLSVASLGLIVELYTPGFGVAGTMGLVALILFFYGHIIAGLAGMETVILLITGIIFIILEFFVPGGILGIIGVGAVVVSLFLSGYDLSHMALSILIAMIVGIAAFIILYRRADAEKGFFKRIILKDRTMTEQGYVTTDVKTEYLGKEGMTVTPLRPAGIAEIGDERVDVVSEGTYIEQGKKVEVIAVEGMRIV